MDRRTFDRVASDAGVLPPALPDVWHRAEQHVETWTPTHLRVWLAALQQTAPHVFLALQPPVAPWPQA